MKNEMNISGKIKELMKIKGFNYKKLSQKTNIPYVSLTLMLKRKEVNNWSVKFLEKIAKVLDTTVSELCSIKTDKPKITDSQKLKLNIELNKVINTFYEEK